jgi:hypothetical protein
MFSIVQNEEYFELFLDDAPVNLRATSKEALFDLATSILEFLQNSEDVNHYGLRSSQWNSIRNKFVEKHPCCSACGSTKLLNVHHIFPFHEYPEMELEESNLITLCFNCHFLFGHLKNWKSHNPNVVNDSNWFRQKLAHRPQE